MYLLVEGSFLYRVWYGIVFVDLFVVGVLVLFFVGLDFFLVLLGFFVVLVVVGFLVFFFLFLVGDLVVFFFGLDLFVVSLVLLMFYLVLLFVMCCSISFFGVFWVD